MTTPTLLDYYRTIGQPFYQEVEQRLRDGRHLALLGQRRGGKSMVMDAVAERADARNARVVRIRGGSGELTADPTSLIDYFAKSLGVGGPPRGVPPPPALRVHEV
jgi:hypothetical protein